ncbi:MAG TPA: MBL fold metallo-hydrolase [Gemmatimonadales bacterium]|jgi:glyoxylase-like metal-dependent hydrolase (beta-lactamase superfamily II)|nr:MBL fold metallo-hydrolase [Gemmatimonadales bacterium]
MASGAPYAIIDLEHQGRPQSVAACLLESDDGPLLVDPGPTSALPTLRAGLAARGHSLADVSALLLTHIHLDHAAASGSLARENPKLRVYVHEAGAPHLVDPSKLLSSATRLYGDRMATLWGEVAPVPLDRVRALQGGERLSLGHREIEVAYTPGHAWHHVSYYERATGVAFVGDTAGIFGPRLPVVLPVTPPPDFDLEAWLGSLDRILAWRPREIVLTHYGPAGDPVRHCDELRAGLLAWAEYARVSLELPGSDADRIRWFVRQLVDWIAGRVPAALAQHLLAGAGPEACWQGLARYWRKKKGPYLSSAVQ